MATFRESVLTGIRNAFCTYLGTAEGFFSSLPRAPLAAGELFPAIPIATTRFARRFLCDREPPPSSDPPFSGGQCAGVAYDVTVFYEVRSNGVVIDTDTRTLRPNGEILGVVPVLDNTPPGTSYQIQLRVNPDTNGGNSFFNVSAGSGGDNYTATASIVSIVRVDGLPDDCGQPLPEPTNPPQPSPVIDIDINYEDADGNSFNLVLPIVFAPVRVNLEGQLTVPFRVSIDPTFEVNANGEININTGDINFNFKNINLPPGGTENQDDYESPDDVPDYPPTVPNSIIPVPPQPDEPSTSTVIRAVIVTVTSYDSNATVIFQGDNPDIYAPNLGFVNFGISIGNAVAWTSDIPVKNFRNFLECNWPGGAIAVRGTPRPGVTWTLTPVRLKIESPVEFA